jgi:MFS family permease
MKIALKYGLLITLGVACWTIIAHLLVPDPQSPIHSVAAGTFFNVLEILGIFYGIRERRREAPVKFSQSVKTGVSIAAVYGFTASLFFAVVVILAPHWIQRRPGTEGQPLSQVAMGAFLGLFLGAIILGIIYSTIISFILGMIDRQRNRASAS